MPPDSSLPCCAEASPAPDKGTQARVCEGAGAWGSSVLESSPSDCSVEPGLRAITLSFANPSEGSNRRKICDGRLEAKSSPVATIGKAGQRTGACNCIHGPRLDAGSVGVLLY